MAINYDIAYLEMTMRQLSLFQADLEEPPRTNALSQTKKNEN